MQPKAADGLEALSPEPNPAARCRARKAIGAWLLTGAALVGLMVLVGGVTRLTGSGLSITHWDIVVGTLPPLTDAAWEVQFTRYQKTPQYHLLNSHMGIEDFKTIFWWEYIHRLIGRLMGLVFVIPFVVFVRKGWIDSGLGRRLSLIFLLG
ncbi:MAG: COX15/CtaA family protein, partial [Acidobacteria bacterium]|nr:COX15/CtaA family protein [Acidobacteriota bacterium]